MRRMFKNAKAFNQPLNNWDVSNVRYGNDSNSNMEQMFNGATVFNQDLSGWCVSNLASQPTNFNSNSLMANEPAFQPRWGSACSPLVILTDSDSDDIIGPGQSMTVTATFDRTISGLAKYSLDNGATYSNMSKVNSSTWNFTIAANTLAENTYNISITATDTSSNTYDISVGTQNGNETGVDIIQFTVDKTSPSVVLTHNHPDNIVGVSDTLLITATFNEAMTGTPTLSFSGLITDTLMDDSANPAVWTYSIDLSTLSIPNSGDYFVTIDGSDMAGNVYSNASGVQDGNETAVDRITFTYYNPPTVILTHNHPDNILIESDTFTVTATFSHAMTSTPTFSFSGLITDALMNNSGDPAVWSYSIDLSTLTIPSNGDYFITVGGNDIAGNTYTNASGAQDGNETEVDRITFTYYKPPTVILTHNHPDNSLDENDTVLVTATFSQAMNSTPTLSFSGLITETLMNNTGDPAVWNYSIDLSTLTIPNNGNYIISVGEEAPANIVRDGLVVHLDAADSNSYSGSGSSWNDISGNGNNFTLFGSPSYDSNINGGVINFDKINDYARSISTSILNRNSYTKVAIYLPQTASRNIISGGGSSESAHAFWMNNTNNFIRAGHNNKWDRVSFSPGNMLNSWHYSAVSFSDIDGFKLYYNGALEDTDPFNTLSVGNGIIRVGAYGNGQNLFDGYIPIVLIYNRVLSLSEIQQNYNSLAQRYGLTPLGISFKLTDIIGNPYLTSNGVQDGNETSADEITFAVDVTPLTVTLTDSDIDDIIYPTDSITVTATFSKAVQNSPTINFSGVGPKNITLSSTASQSVWSYVFDFPSLSVPVGQYTLTVSATDLFGFDIQGNENIVFDYRLFTPTITSSDTIDKIFGDPGFDVTATSSSTGAFSFQIANSSVASITATGSVTINGVGTTSITITQAADPNFSTASKTITLNVVEAVPIITTSPTIINKIFGDPGFDVTATSSSTGAFSFQIANSSVASITATGSVTINGVGTTSITITQAADPNFSTASKTITLNVVEAIPIITTSPTIINKIFGDPGFDVTATSSSTGAFSFQIANSSVASITATGSVTINGVGTTSITITQAADPNFSTASKTITLNVVEAVPIITTSPTIINKIFGDPGFDVTATSSSTGAFSFQIANSSVASITATGSVTINGVGTTSITITQAADPNFSTASKTITLNVVEAVPIITTSPTIINKIFGDPGFDVTATSSSTGAFSFQIANSSVASITATGSVTINGAGTTQITINQAADANFSTASITITLIVDKANPNIYFPDITKIYGDADFTITATSSSTGSFSYLIDDPRIASISQSNTLSVIPSTNKAIIKSPQNLVSLLLSISGSGSTTITAVQNEDSNYNSASASMTLTVLKNNLLNVDWYSTSKITRTFGIPPFELIDPTVPSDYSGVFNFRSSDVTIASISSKDVQINGVGTVTLFADVPADGNYESKTVTVTLEVLKANQSIIIEPLPQEVLKNFASLTVSATSTSGAPVLVSIANGSAANLSGTVGNYILSNIDTSGVVTLTFTTDASAHPNYNSATVTLVIDVSKFNQSITIDPPGSEFILFEEDLTYEIDAYSDQLFNNLNYEIISGTNATINGSTLDIFDIGELKIRVSHPGNNEFNAASQTKIITVLQGITKLSNFNIPEKFINDGEFIIPPPDSNRSGAIRYTSSDTDIAEITGNKIIIKGIGSCIITAVQLGTAQFTSASISTIFIVNDTDFDNDGIGDTEDEDDDNDGMTDQQENENGTDPYNTDTDDDLLEDGDENEIGTDPNDIDTDKDGIIDGLDAFPLDPNESVDTDGDGIGDNSDNDANDDGFSDGEIFVSGLVTPGVIGSEATWKIMNIENYPSAIVSIYNRNGFLVYSKMNYQNDWAGTFDQTGDLLPAGSYYYRIEVPGMEVIEGWLYLTY